VIIEMPGGGGLGDPLDRDPAKVAEDVHLGMVSRTAASRDYGVVLRDDHTIDYDATTAARRDRRA
jgi:N-methylhydantoinase B/oxoprolinase/acetone carboxylase alpha subunit